jgi:hypothetical protein
MPLHPARLRCKNSGYPDIPVFSRLAGQAPHRLKLRTYFFVNPKSPFFLQVRDGRFPSISSH